MAHNRFMTRLLLVLSIVPALVGAAPLHAQDTPSGTPAAADDSQQVEDSDEAYRRRMELEDARHRDPTYVDPQDGYRRELEKIDGLPEASRDNIREQLIDIIVENGEWSPDDARRDYPYQPSAAAQADPALATREQEAWDEQIEKYHAREAAAFGAYRGPAGGPGNPDGPEGGADGGENGASGAGGGQSGQTGQAGENGAAEGSGAAGSYQPYQPARQTADDAASTAGVSESALDYVLGRQARQPDAATGSPGAPQPAEPAVSDQGATAPSQDSTDAAAEPDENTPRDLRGILAIEDLDKLGDSVRPPPRDEDDNDPPDDGR